MGKIFLLALIVPVGLFGNPRFHSMAEQLGTVKKPKDFWRGVF
jgi:hypothetical protein